MNKTECAYCMRNVTAPKSEDKQAPDLTDDTAWAEIAKEHAATCEWVQTRAHQRNAA